MDFKDVPLPIDNPNDESEEDVQAASKKNRGMAESWTKDKDFISALGIFRV